MSLVCYLSPASSDYTGVANVVLFEANEVVREVQVAIIPDDVVEETEVFTATLMAGTGVTIGRNGLATTTITDDDSEFTGTYVYIPKQMQSAD